MGLRRRSVSAIGAACLLVLGAAACGSRADTDSTSKGDSSAPSSESTTTTTVRPASTTSTTAKTSSSEDDQLATFCTTAKPLGFKSLADIQPLDPAGARELRVKLNLIEATAPDDITDTLVTIRKTTDPYLDAVEAGEITDNNTVITWATSFDIPTIDATVKAVPVMGAYIAEHCK